MSSMTVTNFDKAAVLLTRLDPKSLDTVLQMLGPDFAAKLRPALTAVSRRKDLAVLTEQVLQEFRELQQEVRAAVSDSPALQRQVAQDYPNQPPATNAKSGGDESDSKPDRFREAANTSADTQPASRPKPAPALQEIDSLTKLPPAVLAAALKQESPRMIATILKQLPSDVSGKTLEVLPADQRQAVFLLMADSIQINPAIIERILQRILEVCRTIDPAAVDQQDRRVKTLIGVLQTVEREERLRLMESLAERDPALAAQIDDSMYDYMDILRIEDRSVQKLLSQLEQKAVAIALKSAPEDLRQKVLKNLSERVRLALNEEMELLTGVTASKADQARREIANVIRAQDKEGALVWIE